MVKLDIAHKNFIKDLEQAGKSEATRIAYSKDMEQLAEYLQNMGINHIQEVGLTHLEKFMQKLANENYTPKSISRKTNATKTFFRFLLFNNLISENIADLLKHPKVELKAPRILSKIEYRALRDAASDDVRSFAIIEVLLQTGVTISELSEAKLANITFEKNKELGVLFVPKKNGKDQRNVPLNKAAAEAINKYIQTERARCKEGIHLFITKTGKALLIRNIRSTIDRYFKLAGIEKAKVNDLRHTFVAHHLMQGTSLVQVSRVAGHKRLSTTERYLQYIERDVSEEKLELGVL